MTGIMSWLLLFTPITVNATEIIDLTTSSNEIIDITETSADAQVVDLTKVGTTKKVTIINLSEMTVTKKNIRFLKKLKDFDLVAVMDGVAIFEDDKNIVIINFSDVPCGESKKNHIKYGEKLKISWHDETFYVYYTK